MSGGLIGVALGERFLPLLIIKSYGTLFRGLPYCFTPINYEQAFLALIAAIISTVAATLISALSQLFENPSSLYASSATKLRQEGVSRENRLHMEEA